jgi:hypothetical protein
MKRSILFCSIVSIYPCFSTAFLIHHNQAQIHSKTLLHSVSFDERNIALNLPPRENLNQLEQEFREKISIFASFSAEQISSMPNPRLLSLYEGVAASAHDPAVYRAFEVLFEDLTPLRVAGRLIFGRLAQNMEEQLKRRDEIMQLTGLSREEVNQCRTDLDSITGSDHHQLFNSQLEAIVTAVKDTLGEELDLPKGRMSQENILLILSQITSEPSTILQQLQPRNHHKRDAKKLKFDQRYDFMVQSFSEWEDIIPQGEGRRLDVLKGCFVGAKNEKVLKALKIVYVDYSALRFAGDLIFKLVSALIHNRGKSPDDLNS